MSIETTDIDRDLQKLYRTAARECTSDAVDTTILRIAHDQARRNRWRWHLAGAGLAAAAVLAVVVGQIWQRQRSEIEAIRARYATITRAYLLQPQVDNDGFSRATRYLLDRGELGQAGQLPEAAPLAAHPQGI